MLNCSSPSSLVGISFLLSCLMQSAGCSPLPFTFLFLTCLPNPSIHPFLTSDSPFQPGPAGGPAVKPLLPTLWWRPGRGLPPALPVKSCIRMGGWVLPHHVLLLPIRPLLQLIHLTKVVENYPERKAGFFPPGGLNQLQPGYNITRSTHGLDGDGASGYCPHPSSPWVAKSCCPSPAPYLNLGFAACLHPCSGHLPPARCRQVSRQPSSSSAVVPTRGPEPGASVKVYRQRRMQTGSRRARQVLTCHPAGLGRLRCLVAVQAPAWRGDVACQPRSPARPRAACRGAEMT